VGDEWLARLTGLMNATMLVVTTQAEGHLSGCLVGFATQASIRPPRLVVGLSRANHTFGVASRADHLAVHVLARRNMRLAELFGGQTDDKVNKFDHCAWHSGPEGMPILDDAVGWLVGRTLARFDFGDHEGYLLEPVAGWFPESSGDLIHFADVVDLDPGHDA
jgi:flavin reductase (DIM6/NTAB) family NADH-FMN oxidoreductase RutF